MNNKYTQKFKKDDIVYKKTCHDPNDETTYYFMYIAELRPDNFYLCKCHDISLEKIFHASEIILEKDVDNWRKDKMRLLKIERILDES